ncbi:MAG: Bro-N domain-containing protein [Limnobacter sp.]|uniref:BRO-N domain-containing protein n=1 Tax=Limnobacter sp. TaxID=2003368 RepID=UPI00391DED5A
MSKPAPGVPATIPFNFNSTEVRIVMRDGQPWFVAQDVCKALGYVNTSDAVTTHLDTDERYSQSLERGGNQVLINESGLYALVLRSRKPEARKFAKWVTSEVLPSIRTSGQYQKPKPQKTIDVKALLLGDYSEPRVKLPAQVKAAVDKKAFDLAHEAFELAKEHLVGRIGHQAVYGNPPQLDVQEALDAVDSTTPGNALCNTFQSKIGRIQMLAEALKNLSCQYSEEVSQVISSTCASGGDDV